MKIISALLLCALVAAGCDGKTRPTDPVVETAPKAEEPAPEPITLGPDAFEGVTPLIHLPDGAELAVATSSPERIAGALALEPTAESEGLGAGIPGLSDLHPDSLTKLGLDPAAPVAFVRYASYASPRSDLRESRRWAFIAKIGDTDILEQTLGGTKPLEFPEPKEDGVKVAETEGTARALAVESKSSPKPEVWATDDGWAVVTSARFPFATSRDTSLATSEAFNEHREKLEYGELVTLWMTIPESEPVAVGLAMEDDKLGLRAVSTTNEAAAKAIDEIAAHVGSTTLTAGRNSVILGALGSSKEARELEKEIQEARDTPRLRQIEKTTAAVKDRTSEPVEADDAHAELLPNEYLAQLHGVWADAAMTDEESKAIASMEKKLEKTRNAAISNLFGGGGLASSNQLKNVFGDMKGLEAAKTGLIGSKGAFGDGGLKGRGTGGGGTGMGTLGGLGSGKQKIVTISSADSPVKPHASRKVTRLKRCFVSGAPSAPFEVTARVSTDSDGNVSVSSISGANSEVQTCVKRALGGMSSEKNVSGTMTFSFVEK